ncbi:hypothetical protein F542_6230 [Bibersteinia trehalosi USDA-ARS-USMARC-188]|uniref:Uncharacterized protein n=3 Tax=Bibersteinia trehalosi TaxID=47735 RepID=W0R6V3_BIBTR|nr:hypothetical protein WQG_15820 [Bibersteinia trehalosi USDA-ARS-USMARC-192]AHG81341.1 hypothetical protein F542_6230 [Bibersteinia trehalosi USDA-ARS-USMARC-188]AHG83605.1 hypothetical protein F543_7410 [Bibersteinia trehalosi USDA-ARS-USMARC-189]AHG86849.1 hypothetical protein F544_16200 [Bibersteinia trehalosi USDA-ARS-USMARC-190]
MGFFLLVFCKIFPEIDRLLYNNAFFNGDNNGFPYLPTM